MPSGSEGNGYQNRANRYQITLPGDHGNAPVRFALGQQWVTFRMDQAKGKPQVAGAAAAYADVLPGVTLGYEAGDDVVKETITLRDVTAPQRFTFDVRISPGLTPNVLQDGGIDFVDADGKVVFGFDAPYMIDAAGVRSDAVTMTLDPAPGGYRLALAADATWLAAADRAWPVVIDPTVNISPDRDCSIESASANSSYCSNATIWAGRDTSTSSTSRALLRFNVQAAIGDPQMRVLNAELGLYGGSGMYATSGATLGLHRITKSWFTSTTWLNAMSSNPWVTAGGDFDASAADAVSVSGTTKKWYYWYPTELVQQWVDGSSPNNGMLLKATSETANNKMFFTSMDDTANATQRPYLKVIYYPWIGGLDYWQFEQQQLTDRLGLQVNVASGNLLLRQTDVMLKGTGLDLPIDRTYNSLVQASAFQAGSFSLGTGQDILLMPYAHNDRVFYGPSRFGVTFIRNGNGTFKTPSGVNATLVDQGNDTYTLTFNKTGVKYQFAGSALTAIEDRNGNRISFGSTSITDTQGRMTTIGKNAAGKIATITDPAGRVTQYAYDARNNLTSVTDASGKVTRYAYTGYNLTQITDPKGNVTRLAYDTKYRVTSITRVTDTVNGTGPTWTFAYTLGAEFFSLRQMGRTDVTDPNGRTTTYTFDYSGRVTKVTDANGDAQDTFYTSNSDVQRYSDAAGKITNFTYSTDGKNNLVKAEYPSASGTSVAYSFGYGSSSLPYYPTNMTDPQGNVLSYGYDAKGNLSSTTNGLPSQNATTITYNANGTIATVTDPRGYATSYSYDTKGNLTKITPPAPLGAITVAVDGLSRVTSVKDGVGNTTGYTYDAMDRITRITYTDPAGAAAGSISYIYDANGNLTSLTDNIGTTSFTYDRLNRSTKKTLPGGSAISYTYDGVGNLTTQTDGGGTVTYAYNAVNLLSTLTEPDGKVTSFGYDSNRRRTSVTYPNGVAMTMTYDDGGQVKTIVGTKGTTTLTSFSYTYTNASGAETALRQSVTDKDGDKTAYTYDVLNRLTKAETKNGAGGVTATYAYSYDGASNLLSKTVNGTTTSYSYNAANQITNTGYSYDANGNLTTGGGNTFSYNAKNQTASITTSGSTVIAMDYTGASQTQRVKKGNTAFAYSLLGMNSETTGTTTTSYIRDEQGQLVAQRVGTATYYYVFDGLGNTVALTDSAGAVKNTYEYDPYGGVIAKTELVANPYEFGGAYGAYTDDQTKLVKIGERYYDPIRGRWTQLDLLGGGYVYAASSPINYIDPSGLDISLDCALDAVGVLAGTAVFVTGPIGAVAYLVQAGVGLTQAIRLVNDDDASTLDWALAFAGIVPGIGPFAEIFSMFRSCGDFLDLF